MDIDIDIDKLLRYFRCFFWIYWIPWIGQWWYDKYMERLTYRLEDDCIICQYGVFFYVKKKLPYSAIREASIYQGPLLQLIGASQINIHTAGINRGLPEMIFLCVQDPEFFVEEIMNRVIESKQ